MAYEKGSMEVGSKCVGYIRVARVANAPVVAVKTDGDVQEAAIYYRYNATSEKIKYPELLELLNSVRQREQHEWMALLERISKIGPENAAVMDVASGRIDGSKGTLLIDRRVIPKLRFIKEGMFSERGRPVLKLVGTVQPATVSGSGGTGVRVTTDESAPLVRIAEDSLVRQYQLDYAELTRALRRRYSDFKANRQFNILMRRIKIDPNLCQPRYLDPRNPRSGRKDFYHRRVLAEFDRTYTRR